MRARLAILLCLLAAPALAADRHVYLNESGGGTQLDDCPNPAHNAKGTSNTDELEYCAGGGVTAGKVIGTVTGTITSGACTTDGGDGVGTVTAVTNGVSADVDGDGTIEKVYGHPQACVYNMARSDSCEVHAGTYQRPGAVCDSNCGDLSNGGGGQGTCAEWNCYLASVIAYGYGPNMTGTGYGTAALPGYLRGAVMNGSTDTWDADGNRQPDADQSKAVIFSGDFNRNSGSVGVFNETSCSTTDCSGDGFVAVWVGANDAGYNFDAATTYSGVEHGVKIDTDDNGTFDTELNAGTKNVDHFIIKGIKFTGYIGGNGTSNGSARNKEALINLNGNANTDGLKVDRVWMVDNQPAQRGGETFWSLIADMRNKGCADSTEIMNSLLVQENRFIFNDDGSTTPTWGCDWNIHDNRMIVDIASKTWGSGSPAIGYFKNIDYHPEDGRAKIIRFYNNEVIIKRMQNGWLMDLQHFGNSGGAGKGQVWFYGNLFRNDSAWSSKYAPFSPIFCSEEANQTDQGTVYFFNNTFDGWSSASPASIDEWCNNTGNLKRLVEQNNVWIYGTGEDLTTATTVIRANEKADDANKCTASSAGYFVCGTTPTDYNAFAYYTPRSGGALDGTGSCDPDGDGAPGVDYDGDGVNETSWTDLAGNVVSCPTTGTPLDVGAVQSSTVVGPVCGNNVRESPESCDGSDLVSATCISLGFYSGTLACFGNCTYNTTGCALGPVCGNGVIEGPESCDGAALNGQTCVGLGYASGTLTCGSGCEFDVTACVTPPEQTCGNNISESPEECDGTDIGSATCRRGGSITCNPNCTYNAANCRPPFTLCGNNVREAPESCDGADLGGQTCAGLGYASGSLTCNANCSFNTAACVLTAAAVSPNSGGPRKHLTQPGRKRKR